ncbi:MAG: hypothetical protein ACR2KO_05785 [Geodermatophilaceae bacterium]
MTALLIAVIALLGTALFRLTDRIDAMGASVSGRMDSLSSRIEEQSTTLGSRIDEQSTTLGSRIDGLSGTLTARMDSLGDKLDGLRREVRADKREVLERLDVVAERLTTLERAG